jgi:CRP-like cAMP-binding protein
MEFRRAGKRQTYQSSRPEAVKSRTASTNAEQEVLRGASLLIAGCGPVGAQVAAALVESGAEWLTLADPKAMANRQSSPLCDHLFDVNPFATIETSSIDPDGIDLLVSNADLVIDTLDSTSVESLRTRYLLHNTAKRHTTPVVAGLDAGDSGLAIVYDYRDLDQPVLDGVVSEPEIANADGAEVLQEMIRQSQAPGRSEELSVTACADAIDGECALRLAAVISNQLVYDVLFQRPLERLTMVDPVTDQRPSGTGILAAGRKIVAMYSLRRRLRDERRKEKPASSGFSPLNDDIFKDLRPYMEERTYETGSVIIRQGDPAEDFFVLVQGGVQVEHEEHVHTDAPDDFDYEPISTYTVIADLGPGDFFGEMALLSDAPRNASVVVTDRCVVLALSRGAFNLYLEESQPAFQRLREIALARRYENQETYGF